MSNFNAFYSKTAEKYDDLFKHRQLFDQPYGEDLKKMTNLSPGLDIVDMACGTGCLAKVLKLQGFETTILVDPSKEMLGLAASAFPKANSYLMDALEFSHQPINYDRIFISGAFHQFPQGTREQTILNFRSQLRSGGMVVIISHHISPLFKAARDALQEPICMCIEPLKAAGFEVASEPVVTSYPFEMSREELEHIHRARFLSSERDLTDDEIELGISEMNLTDPVACEYKHQWVIGTKK